MSLAKIEGRMQTATFILVQWKLSLPNKQIFHSDNFNYSIADLNWNPIAW